MRAEMRARYALDRSMISVSKMAATLLLLFHALVAASEASDLGASDCGGATRRTLAVLKSRHFPEPYGPGADCTYAVRRRSSAACSVTFLFNVLDVQSSPGCERDYLLLHATGERICGAKPVGFSRTVSFGDEDEMVLSFHSDNDTRGGLGYMVTVVQQDCPLPSCDVHKTERDFTLTSPNFPLPYDNERICTYTVSKAVPSVCRLLLKVRAFDLEEDERCEADFLRVNGDRLCGTLTTGQIVQVNFPNDTLTLEFQSDHVTTRDGFQLEAHQEDCTTTPPPTAGSENVTSEVAPPPPSLATPRIP